MTPTLSWDQLTEHIWDAAVVGAGPAGALAARQLALAGCSVLLIDKAAFPRHKVCGGCLSAAALERLAGLGLGRLPLDIGGQPLAQVRLCAGGRQATLALPGGVAVSRHALDAALVEQATMAGAQFLPHTTAHLADVDPFCRWLALRFLCPETPGRGAQLAAVRCRLVLAADGLGGRLADDLPDCAPRIEPHARIGAGVVLSQAPSFYQAGTVYMACAPGGYLGLVRVEGGQLDLAAALDLPFVQQAGGPGAAAARVLEQAGLPPLAGLCNEPWKATPALTRRRSTPAAERLFVLGDAAGYIEPFTGEGLLWAFTCAAAVTPLAIRAAANWTSPLAAEWATTHRQLVVRRQRICQALAGVLRRPKLAKALVAVLNLAPWLARPVVHRAQSR